MGAGLSLNVLLSAVKVYGDSLIGWKECWVSPEKLAWHILSPATLVVLGPAHPSKVYPVEELVLLFEE